MRRGRVEGDEQTPVAEVQLLPLPSRDVASAADVRAEGDSEVVSKRVDLDGRCSIAGQRQKMAELRRARAQLEDSLVLGHDAVDVRSDGNLLRSQHRPFAGEVVVIVVEATVSLAHGVEAGAREFAHPEIQVGNDLHSART